MGMSTCAPRNATNGRMMVAAFAGGSHGLRGQDFGQGLRTPTFLKRRGQDLLGGKHLTPRCPTFSRLAPGKRPSKRVSPRPPPWVTIGPRKEFQMAGESTPHTGGNKGGWHSGRFAHTFAAIDLGTN